MAKQGEVDQGRGRDAFSPHEKREQSHGADNDQDHRRGSQRPDGNLIQGEDRQYQRWHQKGCAHPVEAPLARQVVRARQDKPAGQRGSQAERHRHPEHPLPIQHLEQQPANGRPGADADRLRRGEESDGVSTPRTVDRFHQDGHAVGAQHRSADPLHDAKHHQPDQARGETAEQRANGKDREAGQIEKLAPMYFARPAEHRQERCESQRIGDGDPPDIVDRSVERHGQRRQGKLDDAAIELADEGTDAGYAYDQPLVVRLAR